MENKAKGALGEAIAITHLRNNGYKILETNYRCKLGEIDIIAGKGETYHFVEVKYRITNKYGTGREAVHYHKQQTIHKVAQTYLINKGLYAKVHMSFDVIEISGHVPNHTLEHLIACF
ncbi:MAG: YraN family protein [Firmicutes bacterium]|nr:YraN family protein [Bacillota bacterium]